MAINKEIETEYGVRFKYHKIDDVRIVTRDNETTLVIRVASYLNKSARIADKEAVYHECCINNADFALTPFYALLKAKFPDYANGKDDFDNSFKETEDVNTEVLYLQQDVKGKNVKKWTEK